MTKSPQQPAADADDLKDLENTADTEDTTNLRNEAIEILIELLRSLISEAELTPEEVEHRLNATERLSADEAEFFADIVEHVTNSKVHQLRAYAAALNHRDWRR